MGQKVHPVGFRLGVIRTWDSKWFEERNYAQWLHEDIKIREFVKKSLGHAGIAKVEIERTEIYDPTYPIAAPEDFVRIHRNALVAPAHLRALERDAAGNVAVVLDGHPERLLISRRLLPQVRKRLRGL